MPLGAMSWDCQAVGKENKREGWKLVRSFIAEGCDEIEKGCRYEDRGRKNRKKVVGLDLDH